MRQALGREYLRRDDMLRLLLDRLRVEGWINERKVVIKASQLCTEEGQAKFVKTVAMAAGKSMTKEHAERTLLAFGVLPNDVESANDSSPSSTSLIG